MFIKKVFCIRVRSLLYRGKNILLTFLLISKYLLYLCIV